MKLFLIRHKATGKIMPLMKRGRGYSHWNPSVPDKEVFAEENVPRFLSTERQANNAINGWYHCRNARNDEDGEITLGPLDNRKKEDLEVVQVYILSVVGGKL